MFDYVKHEMDCPKCGAKITGFQSTDGPCVLAELEYWEVDNFYSSCHNCDVWVEFILRRERIREKFPLEDYEMEVRE